MDRRSFTAMTLHGALVRTWGGGVLIMREPAACLRGWREGARAGCQNADARMAPSLFDRRFAVTGVAEPLGTGEGARNTAKSLGLPEDSVATLPARHGRLVQPARFLHASWPVVRRF
jgi:hypothetical protein